MSPAQGLERAKPAAKAAPSSWRMCTHSTVFKRRRLSVKPFSESPTTP
jgi:hypothetical protein